MGGEKEKHKFIKIPEGWTESINVRGRGRGERTPWEGDQYLVKTI